MLAYTIIIARFQLLIFSPEGTQVFLQSFKRANDPFNGSSAFFSWLSQNPLPVLPPEMWVAIVRAWEYAEDNTKRLTKIDDWHPDD